MAVAGRQHRDPDLLELHDALGARVDPHAATAAAMQMGLATTLLLGATFLFIQINEYVHIGFSARDDAFGSIFYGLTGLHGAHVTVGLMLLAIANIRAWRGHYGPEPEGPPRRRGARDLLALRRRDVDHRLHDRLHPLEPV